MNLFRRSRQAALALASITLLTSSAYAQGNSRLQFATDSGSQVHIMPLASDTPTLSSLAVDTGPLIYNGGPIMPSANIYAIFWVPKTLQNGSATGVSINYESIQTSMLANYAGHGLGANNTQYNQSTPSAYVSNKGSLAGSYIDTSPYPASGCTDSLTPGGCISDAQIQSEVSRVMKKKHWKAGFNNIFMLFTSSGEGSCVSGVCSYSYFCAYHGFFGSPSNPVIYSNQPYGDAVNCQKSGTPSPNNDPVADAAATAASHELTEAITDPELNAWYTSQGNEIGDLCAYKYGTNGWDGALANQMWAGNYFELQEEFDNHVSGCVQIGP